MHRLCVEIEELVATELLGQVRHFDHDIPVGMTILQTFKRLLYSFGGHIVWSFHNSLKLAFFGQCEGACDNVP